MPQELQSALDQIFLSFVQFASVALSIGLPVLVAYGIRIVHIQANKFKASLSVEQAYLLDTGTRIVVKAVEVESESINNKKDEAVRLLDAWLKARGIALPLEEIETKIESAVWDEFNSPSAQLEKAQADEFIIDVIEE